MITECAVAEGDTVTADQLLAVIDETAAVAQNTSAPVSQQEVVAASADTATKLSPSARRAASALSVEATAVQGTGKGGRVTKSDITKHAQSTTTVAAVTAGVRGEKRVPMSRLRQKIAERLVEAQHQAAMLTTFNEVNMAPVMALRKKYKDAFVDAHGTRLGFMSFFTKAAIEALKRFPAVNASIDGTDLIYHEYFDIGVAIGSPRGLVVPILRNAEQMSMADIEKQIRDYADRAQTGKVTIDEMTGGTFTITNGGTFGSMLSTPIVNPPQSAILGMHNIVERPVVEAGNVVVRPVMYLALSYDHRVIDGRESVLFLRTIKEMIEDPSRLLLEV